MVFGHNTKSLWLRLQTGKVMVKILKLKKINSTNDFAKELLRLYPLEEINNTVVCAKVQTKGRGVGSNEWLSEPYKNLTFSLIHEPAYLYIDEIFYLSKVSALALATFLHSENILAYIKWPNDIIVSGKKISGILIENSISGTKIRATVIGIGLNVNQISFPPVLNATSMKQITGQTYDLDKTLNLLLEKLFFWLEKLQQGRFDVIDSQYHSLLFNYKKSAKFRKNGEFLEGTVLGVDQFGRLLLEVPGRNAVMKFAQKEVELVYE